jgi:hypothetical protein
LKKQTSRFYIPPPPEVLELKWIDGVEEGDAAIPMIMQDEGQVCSVVAVFNCLSRSNTDQIMVCMRDKDLIGKHEVRSQTVVSLLVAYARTLDLPVCVDV